MISLYDIFMFPLERLGISKHRKIILQEAYGNVLEIGSGTGINAQFYNNNKVTKICMTNPRVNKHLNKKTRDNLCTEPANASQLSYQDNTFDTIVHTLVFCSVDHKHHGMQELKRVLKDDGQILFIEHVLPKNRVVRFIFKLINPLWMALNRECTLTHNFLKTATDSGFQVVKKDDFFFTSFIHGSLKKRK